MSHERALEIHSEAWERWRRARRAGEPDEVVDALRVDLLGARRQVTWARREGHRRLLAERAAARAFRRVEREALVRVRGED